MPPQKNPVTVNGHVILFRGVIALMALQTTILIAGIPWAFRMNGAVSSIQAQMEFVIPVTQSASQKEFMSLLERVVACEIRIQDLKSHQNTGDPFDALPNRK